KSPLVQSHIPEILKTQWRFLLFKPVTPNLRDHFSDYFAYVVLISLAVGVGRYWDHLDAEPWQYFGIGSLAYIFTLSLVLYLLVLPLKPRHWSFKSVLIFVGLTSLPALLYALPVERFLSIGTAQSINAMFLATVAIWRVALYVNYLKSVADLGSLDIAVAVLLPISLIVVALSILNLEHAVFQIMAGNPMPPTSGDLSYFVVLLLSFFAFITLPVTVVLYLVAIYQKWKTSPVQRS
ncbi:MAG: hypothetical protein AAGF35_04805, partial [Pseudomonadota bacterium]